MSLKMLILSLVSSFWTFQTFNKDSKHQASIFLNCWALIVCSLPNSALIRRIKHPILNLRSWFLSSPSACRTSEASKNRDYQIMETIDLCNFGVTWCLAFVTLFLLVELFWRFFDKFFFKNLFDDFFLTIFLMNFLMKFFDEIFWRFLIFQ